MPQQQIVAIDGQFQVQIREFCDQVATKINEAHPAEVAGAADESEPIRAEAAPGFMI
jgi:hypothetical protein